MREVVRIPTGHSASHGNAFLVGLLFEEADGEAFEPSQIVSRMAVSQPTLVLAERDIQTPVLLAAAGN